MFPERVCARHRSLQEVSLAQRPPPREPSKRSACRPHAPVILLALLLVPSAIACDFGEEPPRPARIGVWDSDEERIVAAFELDARMLGSLCELANPHALEGDVLVWVEPHWSRRGESSRMKVGRLSTGEVRVLDAGGLRVGSIALADGVLYALAWDVTDRHRVLAFDLASGEVRELPLAEEARHASRAGGFVVVQAHGDPERRLSIYDAGADEWILRGALPADVGLPDSSGFMSGRAPWIVFHGRNGTHALDVRSLEVHRLPDLKMHPQSTIGVDADALWLHEGALVRVSLPGGAITQNPVPPLRPMDAVDEGRIVIGTFSAPAAEPADPLSQGIAWLDETPLPPSLAVLAVAVAVVLYRMVGPDESVNSTPDSAPPAPRPRPRETPCTRARLRP